MQDYLSYQADDRHIELRYAEGTVDIRFRTPDIVRVQAKGPNAVADRNPVVLQRTWRKANFSM